MRGGFWLPFAKGHLINCIKGWLADVWVPGWSKELQPTVIFRSLEKLTSKSTETSLSWIITALVVVEYGWACGQMSWQHRPGLGLGPVSSICLAVGVSLEGHQPSKLALQKKEKGTHMKCAYGWDCLKYLGIENRHSVAGVGVDPLSIVQVLALLFFIFACVTIKEMPKWLHLSNNSNRVWERKSNQNALSQRPSELLK